MNAKPPNLEPSKPRNLETGNGEVAGQRRKRGAPARAAGEAREAREASEAQVSRKLRFGAD